jgi:hypothetical protein
MSETSHEARADALQQQEADEAPKKPRRNLTVNEKLIALRDQKRGAYAKLGQRVSAAEAAFSELKRQRNIAYEELQRIEAACPRAPGDEGPQPPPQEPDSNPAWGIDSPQQQAAQ